MTPIRRQGAATDAVAALAGRAEALARAVEAGGDLLDAAAARHAADVARRVGERTALVGGHVVVALAGSTGAGKSSIFNALVGEDVAEVGVRRPMTSVPRAAVWGDDGAGPLLDWLGVARRHRVAGGDPGLAGLVLVDLPDFDSREAANRAEAERLLELVDLFVWVTDHQKYADAVIHDQFVATHKAYGRNTLVVLNHADELPDAQVATVVADLTRLLEADGLADPRVIATSARTGRGLDELRGAVRDVIADHQASLRRLQVDVAEAARALRDGLGTAQGTVSREARDALVTALSRAAGAPAALDAVERSYRRDALGRTGVVFTRWRRSLTADPLSRLRLDRLPGARSAADTAGAHVAVERTSLPAASPAARAEAQMATSRLAQSASAGLPPRWTDAVDAAAHPPDADLRDALDRALGGAVERHRSPAWWHLAGALQWVFAAMVVVGVLWYLALGLAGWLQFALPDVPRYGPVPYPFILIVAGIVFALVVSFACRVVAGAAARRRRAAVARRVRDAVGQVADRDVIAPVEAVLARHRAVAGDLARAAGDA